MKATFDQLGNSDVFSFCKLENLINFFAVLCSGFFKLDSHLVLVDYLGLEEEEIFGLGFGFVDEGLVVELKNFFNEPIWIVINHSSLVV